MDVGPGDYVKQLVADMAAESAEARRMVAIGERAAGLTVTQQAPDGSVRVTVNQKGAVLDIAFSDAVRRLDPRRLSGAVLGTIRQAQAGIAARYERIVRESGVAEATAERLIGRFRAGQPQAGPAPFVPPAPPAPAAPPPPVLAVPPTPPSPPQPASTAAPPHRPARPAPDEADDDFGDTFTVLQRGYRKP